MLNVVAIMGRLTADPPLRKTPQGTSVTTFSIACDRSYARQGEERQCDFFDVTCWRQTADFVCKYFQKGSLIAIDGRLQSRTYQDKSGNNRTAIEIVANSVNFGGAKNQNHPGGQPAPQQVKQPPTVQYSAGSIDDFEPDLSEDDLPWN